MAQLHVQKKRSQLGWLWIVIILLVLAVVYYLYGAK
jgi:ABC-type polysaccharide/polyol phosphate export permease